MLLRRTIDDADGKNFVAEYGGVPIIVDFDQGNGCCDSGFDLCLIGGDGICSCPESPFDTEDYSDAEELVAGANLIANLAEKYAYGCRSDCDSSLLGISV
ncbi:MAG: hypothetical protein GY811_29225 [Myxococcales bacterium]|nr:hypothetical protein [Myxococcales bacterium]